METTYIVTGRHRTGTSMMMRCLDLSSDLLAEVDPENDNLMHMLHANREEYHPNPNGYYLSHAAIFPQDIPGGLIKLSLRNVDWPKTEPGDYRVIWMIRDEQVRLASWEKAFGYPEHPTQQEVYERNEMGLLAREDCKITFVNYAECVKNPLGTFETIAAAGWPIDPEKAAALVDPSLYRNRAN